MSSAAVGNLCVQPLQASARRPTTAFLPQRRINTRCCCASANDAQGQPAPGAPRRAQLAPAYTLDSLIQPGPSATSNPCGPLPVDLSSPTPPAAAPAPATTHAKPSLVTSLQPNPLSPGQPHRPPPGQWQCQWLGRAACGVAAAVAALGILAGSASADVVSWGGAAPRLGEPPAAATAATVQQLLLRPPLLLLRAQPLAEPADGSSSGGGNDVVVGSRSSSNVRPVAAGWPVDEVAAALDDDGALLQALLLAVYGSDGGSSAAAAAAAPAGAAVRTGSSSSSNVPPPPSPRALAWLAYAPSQSDPSPSGSNWQPRAALPVGDAQSAGTPSTSASSSSSSQLSDLSPRWVPSGDVAADLRFQFQDDAAGRGVLLPPPAASVAGGVGKGVWAVRAPQAPDGGWGWLRPRLGSGGADGGGRHAGVVDAAGLGFGGDGGGGGGGGSSSRYGSRGAGGYSEAEELASETEDRLLEVARQVEARVEGMLGALASSVPQLMVGADASEEAARSTAAAHALIQEVWEVVDANYLDARATGFDRQHWAELRDAALAVPYRDTASGYRAIRDLLARGLSDPYCRFILPAELEAMKKYDVSGVGLNLGTAAEYVIKTGNELPAPRDPTAGDGVFVVGVSKGSTADVAGIRQGDELLEIQGQPLDSTTPFRAAGLISGAVQEEGEGQGAGADGAAGRHQQQQQASSRRRSSDGSRDVVRVKVRHVSGQVEDLRVVRPRRTLPSTVTTSLARSPVALPGGGRGEEVVGTVRLAAFNARAQADVAAAIRQLEAAGATRLVLDLRDNRGGLVTEGLEVAKLFLEGDSPIVITARRDTAPDTPVAPGPPLTTAPLLVLVNGHTASASEIVAGALHDNCRAVLAGSRTYGKGLIQSVYELSDGSGLVITVGKYMTPRGIDIDRYGIKPDFSSVPSAAQYDSTVKACKTTAPATAVASLASAAPPPSIYY